MHHKTLLSLLRKIQSCPTAPFHEYHVRNEILGQLKPLKHVSVKEDAYGNVIATYRKGKSTQKTRLAFGAHMDHPGWVKAPGKEGEAVFLGGVPKDRLDKCPIEWFDDFGMWLLSPFHVEDGIIHSRVCDDLVGCAAIVALMIEMERVGIETTIYGIFTRAEEVGFVGAVELAKRWPLPKSTVFVSLETSAPRGGAVMGEGPVIRVGDRMSIFHDGVTAELLDAAEDAKISVQRHLLDGGACEATAMQLYGVPSAGISVLLGNYHNCTPEGGIAEEFVSMRDVRGLVKLITSTAVRLARNTDSSKDQMKTRLEKRVVDHQIFADESAEAWKAKKIRV